MLTISFSVLKMTCVVFIVRLQRDKKTGTLKNFVTLRYINKMLCVLIMLHYFKHIEYDT